MLRGLDKPTCCFPLIELYALFFVPLSVEEAQGIFGCWVIVFR